MTSSANETTESTHDQSKGNYMSMAITLAIAIIGACYHWFKWTRASARLTLRLIVLKAKLSTIESAVQLLNIDVREQYLEAIHGFSCRIVSVNCYSTTFHKNLLIWRAKSSASRKK